MNVQFITNTEKLVKILHRIYDPVAEDIILHDDITRSACILARIVQAKIFPPAQTAPHTEWIDLVIATVLFLVNGTSREKNAEDIVTLALAKGTEGSNELIPAPIVRKTRIYTYKEKIRKHRGCFETKFVPTEPVFPTATAKLVRAASPETYEIVRAMYTEILQTFAGAVFRREILGIASVYATSRLLARREQFWSGDPTLVAAYKTELKASKRDVTWALETACAAWEPKI